MEVRPKIHVLQDQFGRVIAVRFSYGIGVFVKYVRKNQKNTDKYAEALVNGPILYRQEALRKAKRILLFLDNIEDCIVKFDEQCISTQDAFDTLIFLLGNLISEKLEIDETFDTEQAILVSKEVTKVLVAQSMLGNQKFKFLKFFDEDGNVIQKKSNELRHYVMKVIDRYKELFPTLLTQDLENKIIVSEEDLAVANEIREKEEKEIRLAREEEKKKIEKKLSRGIQPIKKQEPKRSIYDSPKYKELLQIYNPISEEIKKGVCQKYDFDTFVSILEKFFDKPEDKPRIKSCIEQYKNQIREIRFNRLKRVLKKHELENLNKILKNSENENAKIALNRYINSEEFNLDSDSDVRETIMDIINEMIAKDNTTPCNFIIFPDSNLLDDEMAKFKAEKTHHRLDTIFGVTQTQFRTLQSHSIQDIKSKKKDEFHELWWEKGKVPLTVDKLKFYRYGHHKAKIALATIPVTEKNQEELNKYFNTTIQSIIVVVGFSNIDIEDEHVFYQSVRRYASNNREKLTEICRIFSTDFTDETRAQAIELINNSKLIMSEFMKNSQDSEEDEKTNTLVRPSN